MVAPIIQFQPFEAVFDPLRTDDLGPGAAAWIGRSLTFEAAWVIEDGEYQGLWACATYDRPAPPFAWVPECDLRPSDPDIVVRGRPSC